MIKNFFLPLHHPPTVKFPKLPPPPSNRTLAHLCMKAFHWRVFLLRKFAPWREDLDSAIMTLQQFGLMNKIFNPTLPYDIRRNPNLFDYDDNHPLSLEHVTTSFLFYISGMFLGSVAFAVELFKLNLCSRKFHLGRKSNINVKVRTINVQPLRL